MTLEEEALQLSTELKVENPASQVTVQSIMSADLVGLRASDRVGRARDLILSIGIHALPVMDGNLVVGIVTSSDLVDDWPESELVGTIMSNSPVSINAAASLCEAAEAMLSGRMHHLLVESSGETVGILSSLDLLRAFCS